MPPADFGRTFFLKKCKTHEFSDNSGFCQHVRVFEMPIGRESDDERKQMECRHVIFERLNVSKVKTMLF